jgi:hypothetical protein
MQGPGFHPLWHKKEKEKRERKNREEGMKGGKKTGREGGHVFSYFPVILEQFPMTSEFYNLSWKARTQICLSTIMFLINCCHFIIIFSFFS